MRPSRMTLKYWLYWTAEKRTHCLKITQKSRIKSTLDFSNQNARKNEKKNIQNPEEILPKINIGM